MIISVISIGSELLKDKLNTNLIYISKKLNFLGLPVSFSSIVKDDEELLTKTFEYHIKNSDIIITTGGLGPTLDDITLNTVAKLLNKKLVFVREIYEKIVKHFIEKNQEVPKLCERQAYVIDGAEILFNKIGHAPGEKITFKKNDRQKIIYLLPGPPREMQLIFDEYIIPQLKNYQTKFYKEIVIHLCDIPESKVQELISPLLENQKKYYSNIEFALLPHLNLVDVKVTIFSEDELKLDEEFSLIKKEIFDIFSNSEYKNSIYGQDNETLEYIVAVMLAKKKKKLAVAESCTGGFLSNRITNIPGSSFYFIGSFIAYSNFLKTKILNVKKETLDLYGSVSKEVVKEMCIGLKNLTSADYCISISGIAGPGGGTQEKPVGSVWICVYDGNQFSTKLFKFLGTRTEIKEQATNSALNMLRLKLCEVL